MHRRWSFCKSKSNRIATWRLSKNRWIFGGVDSPDWNGCHRKPSKGGFFALGLRSGFVWRIQNSKKKRHRESNQLCPFTCLEKPQNELLDYRCRRHLGGYLCSRIRCETNPRITGALEQRKYGPFLSAAKKSGILLASEFRGIAPMVIA